MNPAPVRRYPERTRRRLRDLSKIMKPFVEEADRLPEADRPFAPHHLLAMRELLSVCKAAHSATADDGPVL